MRMEYKGFKSNLTGRIHRTRNNREISKKKKLTVGVPQGSVLGTLLFIICINGFKNVLKSLEITVFADDVLVYIRQNIVNEFIKLVEAHIGKFGINNKLNNIDKIRIYRDKHGIYKSYNKIGIGSKIGFIKRKISKIST